MHWMNKNVIWVQGYCKSAIYDFESSNVYWADEELTNKIKEFIFNNIYSQSIDELINNGLIDTKYIRKYEYNDNYEYSRMAWLELTQKCNLKCLHCYTGDKHISSTNSMSLDEWKNVIDVLHENNFSTVVLIGGEPLLFPEIKELINYIYAKNINMILFSNITLLNDELIDIITEKKIVVYFSMYSADEIEHDLITKVKGSYRKMINSLEKLLSHGVTVKPAVTIMKENNDATKGIVELLKKYSLKLKKIDCIRPMEGGSQSLHMPSKDVIRSFEMHHPNFKANRLFFDKAVNVNTCLYGKLAVSETGEVFPCEFIRNVSFGNIRKTNFKDILANLKKNIWTITAKDIEDCKDCEFKFACRDCRHLGIDKPYKKKYRCFYNPKLGKFE